ncbi:MAG: outer membrane lipoprotein chaperone LolA [SAR324 cluster bacterium]|nr:outer membrane lipoprotein chaperone LolA [SAR324 cluster bacterium]
MLLRSLSLGLPLLLLCPTSLFADALLLQRIQTRYQQTGSFTARFVQVDQRPEAEERRAEGTVRYKRPGRMRWHYESPEEQLLVTDGETLWLYDPLLENVTIQRIERVAPGTVLAFLLGVGDLESDFRPRRQTQELLEPPRGVVLELEPRRELANLDFLQLEVDPLTSDLLAMVLVDGTGNVRIIRLEDMEREVKLADAEFVFEVTPDLEVIRPE